MAACLRTSTGATVATKQRSRPSSGRVALWRIATWRQSRSVTCAGVYHYPRPYSNTKRTQVKYLPSSSLNLLIDKYKSILSLLCRWQRSPLSPTLQQSPISWTSVFNPSTGIPRRAASNAPSNPPTGVVSNRQKSKRKLSHASASMQRHESAGVMSLEGVVE